MKTICEVTGAEYPTTFACHDIIPSEGVSFMPIFDGETKLPERTLFFDHFRSSAIRKGDWKLVRGNHRYNDRTWELYNIGSDRCETSNLIGEKPELAENLEAQWASWAKRVKIAPYYVHTKKQ